MASNLHVNSLVTKEKYVSQTFSDNFGDFGAVMGGRMP
jgi:hypothetical protein